MKKRIVALVGRPNVGKSTLFNRIIRRREAIVHNIPGVTRDRIYAQTEWAGTTFTLIDTGGYLPESENVIQKAVLMQVQQAMSEANVIVFLVDAQTGITNIDLEISRYLKRVNKKVLLTVNKVDSEKAEANALDFYQLGLGEPVTLSAISGRKVGDFLDDVIELLPPISTKSKEDDNAIRLAVVGRPNVGKSSFINAILGLDKLIVTEIPGTTRDAIDTPFKYYGQDFLLIDTAGLRRRSHVKESIEYYSNIRSLNSIHRCHIAIIIIDAIEGLTDQDRRIIEQAISHKKGIILAINKWDLIEKNTNTARDYELILREELRGQDFLPIIFISALKKTRVYKIIDIAKSVYQERTKRIKTSKLNEFLKGALEQYAPSDYGKKQIKIKYCTQVKTAPPVFAFFANFPHAIKENYKKYLENKLRQQYGFLGVPLTLVFKEK